MDFELDDLPRSPAEWENARRGLEAESIQALGKLDSASEIQKPQFLMLRALWDRKLQNLFEVKDWLEEADIERAVSFLRECPDWNIYLESFSQKIKLDQRPFPGLGAFTLVKYSQLEAAIVQEKNSSESVVVSPRKTRSMTVLEKSQNTTPSKPTLSFYERFLKTKRKDGEHEDGDDDEDSLKDETAAPMLSPWSAAKKGDQKVWHPPTEDEQIVNAALLNFLTAVTIAHPDACLRWCLARRVLQFVCKDETHGEVKYQARTDGYLRGQNHSPTYAIVEVKPYIRTNTARTIWQETAQMAAWIVEDPAPKGKKFQ